MTRKKIGIMISGTGTNMQAITRACQIGYVDADVAFVGSDNPNAKGLVWAQDNKIPTFVVDYTKKPLLCIEQKKQDEDNDVWVPSYEAVKSVMTKSTFVKKWFGDNFGAQYVCVYRKMIAEHHILAKAREYNIDLLVAAGFMEVFTSFIIDEMNNGEYNPRIVNIHPALLPSFPGVDGYGDTIRYGCKVGGCTVHFVDYGEDTGPIIGQCAIPVLPDDDVDSFRERGLQEEYKLFPECIQLFVQGKLKLETVEGNNGSTRKIVKIL